MKLIDKQEFKKSEAGLIPEDWECHVLSDVCVLKHGFQFLDEHFRKNGVGVVKIGNLRDGGGIKEENLTFVSHDLAQKLSNFLLNEGDVLMALTGGTLGKVSVVNTKKTLLQNYRVGNFIPKSHLSKKYLNQILISFYIKRAIDKLVNEAAQPNFGKQDFDKLFIPIPPTLEEQKSIATALSDVDELISGLEKLISKKKDIKQGAMQQLLTPPHKGGKRLPGFSGEWVEKRLEDLTSMSSGGTPSSKNSKYYDGQIIWVSITDMSNSGKYISDSTKKITNIGLQNSSARMFTINTLLLAMYASIGKCCITTKEVSTSQAILGINTAKELSTEFLYYFFLFKQKELASQGQQGTQSNLNKGMVQDLLISTPEIVEQQAIAQTLSDMDTEIAQLETKKEKYQAIKQGMMQELLTGKTRLL